MTTRDIPDLRLDRGTITVKTLFDDSDEIEYWQAASLRERLQHIERLRRINYGVRATARLQRVIRVIKCE